jgi:hypothetical protein
VNHRFSRFLAPMLATSLGLGAATFATAANVAPVTFSLLQTQTVSAGPVVTPAINVGAFEQVTITGLAKGAGTVSVQCFFVDQPNSDPRNVTGTLVYFGAMFPGFELGFGSLVRFDGEGLVQVTNIPVPVSAPFIQCIALNTDGLTATVSLKAVAR